jgi:hypothetical protein
MRTEARPSDSEALSRLARSAGEVLQIREVSAEIGIGYRAARRSSVESSIDKILAIGRTYACVRNKLYACGFRDRGGSVIAHCG